MVRVVRTRQRDPIARKLFGREWFFRHSLGTPEEFLRISGQQGDGKAIARSYPR
jgi:hypothetical protein